VELTNYGNGQNRLAEKLRYEYRNRGASLSGVQAAPTSELMARAQMGRDPKVNVSAQAFDDRLQGKQFRGYYDSHMVRGGSDGKQVRYASVSGQRKQYGYSDGYNGSRAEGNSSAKSARSGGYYGSADNLDKAYSFSKNNGFSGSYGESGAKGSGARQNGSEFGSSAKDGVGFSNLGGGTKNNSREHSYSGNEKGHYVAGAKNARNTNIDSDDEDVFEEIKAERKKMPWSVLVSLAVCTMMIMLVILSIAQVYQKTQEVSGLEDEITSLKQTIDDLELKLDEKNDIRLIEQMATTELGMVKEDSLQRKYISLSDGERVDLIEDTSADSSGMGTMLSSIFSVFSNFFEYFK